MLKICLLALTLTGCGSSSNPGAGDGGGSNPALACNSPASGSGHICSEYDLTQTTWYYDVTTATAMGNCSGTFINP